MDYDLPALTQRPSHRSSTPTIPSVSRRPRIATPPRISRWCKGHHFHLATCCGPPGGSVAMATNREQQVGHMTGFPPAVYPFAFNSMRSHSPFDLLANSSLFGRFGADLPKEMAALCESFSSPFDSLSLSLAFSCDFFHFSSNYIHGPYRPCSQVALNNLSWKEESTAT